MESRFKEKRCRFLRFTLHLSRDSIAERRDLILSRCLLTRSWNGCKNY